MFARRFDRTPVEVLAMVISGATAGLAGPVHLSTYEIIDPNTAVRHRRCNDRFGSTMCGAQQIGYGAILAQPRGPVPSGVIPPAGPAGKECR